MIFKDLLWLLPGFIGYYFYSKHAIPSREKNNWDLIFPILLYSTVAILVTAIFKQCLIILGFNLNSMPGIISSSISQFFVLTSFDSPLLLMFSCTVAPFLGYLWAKPLVSCGLLGVIGLAPKMTPYQEMLSDLEGKVCIISMKSPKTYIGILLAYTSDPNEKDKYIRFLVYASGLKCENKIFYRKYFDDKSDEYSILISFEEIQYIGQFSFSLFERLLKSGAIELLP